MVVRQRDGSTIMLESLVEPRTNFHWGDADRKREACNASTWNNGGGVNGNAALDYKSCVNKNPLMWFPV